MEPKGYAQPYIITKKLKRSTAGSACRVESLLQMCTTMRSRQKVSCSNAQSIMRFCTPVQPMHRCTTSHAPDARPAVHLMHGRASEFKLFVKFPLFSSLSIYSISLPLSLSFFLSTQRPSPPRRRTLSLTLVSLSPPYLFISPLAHLTHSLSHALISNCPTPQLPRLLHSNRRHPLPYTP